MADAVAGAEQAGALVRAAFNNDDAREQDQLIEHYAAEATRNLYDLKAAQAKVDRVEALAEEWDRRGDVAMLDALIELRAALEWKP